jgi:hypothetical protein
MVLIWISEMSSNQRLFKASFSFGFSQKSQGAKSGKQGGWYNFVIDFLARNSCC